VISHETSDMVDNQEIIGEYPNYPSRLMPIVEVGIANEVIE